MQITRDFSLWELCKSEYAQKNRIYNEPSEEVIENLSNLACEILQPLRRMLGVPIYVTSGYRCKTLNDRVGGAKKSQHLVGQAVDIKCKSQADTERLWQLIRENVSRETLPIGQAINEFGLKWIHVSTKTEEHQYELLASAVKGNKVVYVSMPKCQQ